MQEVIITHPSDAGQRLDKFIKKYFPGAPLGGIYKMLRVGKIKVNRKKTDQTYKLELDDTIQLFLSDEEIVGLQVASGKLPGGNKLKDGEISETKSQKLEILYEDEYLLVVNKPAGINVHPGDHKTKEVSLIELVQDYLGDAYNSLTFRPSLVHRIDRDTSGCIMIAKTKETLEALLDELQSHRIDKTYHALVVGKPQKLTGTIRAKILRIENAKNEAKVKVDDAGQTAVTHYTTVASGELLEEREKRDVFLATSNQQLFSLLECQIETGRTHQIRVHLAHIGHPILGDKVYGNASSNSFIRRQFGVSRQLLHAFRLSFFHPRTKKELIIEAPYPEDFTTFLKRSPLL